MQISSSNDVSHVFHFFLNREYVSIDSAKGIYLYDDKGNRYIDASGGPILCNLGHGLEEMAEVLADQAKKVAYVHRIDFTNPPLIEAAHKVCKSSDFAMDKVFFVSGGTEAIEIGVKIARKYHLDNELSRQHGRRACLDWCHGQKIGFFTLSS